MKEQNAATGWIGQAVQALVIIVTTWQLFAKEIHGYIDTAIAEERTELVRDLARINAGQMLMVMDSTTSAVRRYYDSTATRLVNLEELVGVRPSNRTIITAPDTVAIRRLQRDMAQLQEGVEAILDGQAQAQRVQRLRRQSPMLP